METNILDVLGLQIVDYFINFQNFQPFNIPEKFLSQKKGKAYLVNQTGKYQIIKIIKQEIFNENDINEKDEVFDYIKKELFQNNDNFRILILVVNNNDYNEKAFSPNIDKIIATPKKMIDELEILFPTIKQKIQIEDDAEDQNNDEENEDISPRQKRWQKINFQNRHLLKNAILKSQSRYLITFWLFFMTGFATMIAISASIGRIPDIPNIINYKDNTLFSLIFGGSYHNLIFGANQYWRWISYPFTNLDPVLFLFSVFLFYLVGRFVEGFYGPWKSLIIWIGGIIITGVVQSSIDQYGVMSGFMIMVYISLGALIPIVWNYKLFKSKLMYRMISITVVLFLAWTSVGYEIISILIFIIALISGILMGSLVSYKNRQLSLFYAVSPVFIGILIVMSIILIVANRYQNYDAGGYTVKTLRYYKQMGLNNQGFIDWVNNWFFHTK